ncbi:bifunctional 2-polyprenyl-6-hydroxyphenol methylase/3-demethylubiquinol 3-O-methyltransferase UbiG [uncultured Pseudokineococcus sp.]|uniref:class I SAM-dependent methyltransferase n=1 Tax=uncultured Pseudokineococcus sp. TaxID=1642928 RepID=UPI002632ACFE|nr:hypothetical protein [uncultured Pseudokineococcus sp.]
MDQAHGDEVRRHDARGDPGRSRSAGPGAGADVWDARHARSGTPGDPHPVVRAVVGGLRPGRAVDLACGAGRHALLLASAGWSVDAVDLSRGGLDVGRAAPGGDAVRWHRAEALGWLTGSGRDSSARADLVLDAFAQLPGVVPAAAARLAAGGHLVVVGHARRDAGLPGVPRDARLLHDVDALARAAASAGLEVLRAEDVARPHEDGSPRHDAVLLARRPG